MEKILLIEDEQRMREIITDYFEDKGSKVRSACNGLEGLEFLEEDKVDLILLDVMN